MIECHPLLRPIVQLAKPVVHAVRHPYVGVRHHIHHVHRAVTSGPGQTVMTVCQRVAGPIVAGGLVLLPPASAVPPAGGVGGFPGAAVPEYGAPAFAPGFIAPAPFASSPGTYGPAALGLGAIGGILGPTVVASNTPQTTVGTSPGTTTPGTTTTTPATTTTPPDGPGTPTNPTATPPGTTTPPTNTTPPSTPPAGNGAPPGGDTPPGGGDTPPTNAPEPASVAVLAGALVAVFFSRALWTRRNRRG